MVVIDFNSSQYLIQNENSAQEFKQKKIQYTYQKNQFNFEGFIENQGQVANELVHYYCCLPGENIGFDISRLNFIFNTSNENEIARQQIFHHLKKSVILTHQSIRGASEIKNCHRILDNNMEINSFKYSLNNLKFMHVIRYGLSHLKYVCDYINQK